MAAIIDASSPPATVTVLDSGSISIRSAPANGFTCAVMALTQCSQLMSGTLYVFRASVVV